MQINISGHQVEIGQSLQEYVKQKLETDLAKFFTQIVDIKVIFEKHTHHLFSAEISIHESGYRQVFSKIENTDVYKAFDESLHKIEIQLKKHKDKSSSHHQIRVDKEGF